MWTSRSWKRLQRAWLGRSGFSIVRDPKRIAHLRFLFSQISIVSTLGALLLVLGLTFDDLESDPFWTILKIATMIFIAVLSRYVLYSTRYVKRTYLYGFILAGISYLFASSLIVYDDLLSPIALIVIVISLILISINYHKYLRYVLILSMLFMFFILYRDYSQNPISHTINSLLIIYLIWLTAKIADIGFREIDSSYQKALEANLALKQLNSTLEDEVERQSLQLREEYTNSIKNLSDLALISTNAQSVLHDLKTPLSSLRAALELDGGLIGDRAIAFKQLDQILKDKNSYRPGDIESIDINLRSFFNELWSMTATVSQKDRISTVIEVDKNVYLTGYSVLICRVISNIYMNGVNALAAKKGDDGSIKILGSWSDEQDMYLIQISDNGVGNQNSKKSENTDIYPSSGLGLKFVRDSADLIGAQLSVDIHENGCDVSLSLPRSLLRTH